MPAGCLKCFQASFNPSNPRFQEQAHVKRSKVLRHWHMHHQRRRPLLVWPALGWREDVLYARTCVGPFARFGLFFDFFFDFFQSALRAAASCPSAGLKP